MSGGPQGEAADAFLGVERSATGRRWISPPLDERLAIAIAQRTGVPELVARLLARRIGTLDAAAPFLAPRLRHSLPDPDELVGMGAATDRLVRAITAGERIAVFADYDVDGATSAALLARFLRAVGVEGRVYVPDRIGEGYGPNAPAMMRLREEGIDLVVTVDCGTTAFAALEAAAKVGLDVVVVDHHAAEPVLPPAVAIVNPNRLDQPQGEQGGLGMLAAVGVTFLAVVALNRALRAAGHYRRVPEPDLLSWLDLVALGTVADVVPLVGINRVLVAQGLKVMAGRRNPGLAALADVARLRQAPDAYALGFLLGPRVNAGGRIGEAGLGARLLATDDPLEAEAIARRLDALNAERREIEAAVLEQAGLLVERAANAPVLLVAGDGWHQGVIGIVASRLVERFGRPACVVALGDGVGKGSGRSVRGVDLGAAVIAARQAGLLIAGGGHPMAAGFTVAADRLDALAAFLAERTEAAVGALPRAATLTVEAAVAPSGASPELARLIEGVGPFGAGNPEPKIALPSARIEAAAVVGDGHVRCRLGDDGGRRVKAIAFRAAAGPLGQMLLAARGAPLHAVGHLRADRWQGAEGVQLVLEDVAEPRRR